MPITIDTYTGRWQSALRPSAPRIGSHVRVAYQPDDREADDFKRCLAAAGLGLEWISTMPRKRVDVYRIVR